MTLDWDTIKSILQIPRKWFKDISKKVDNMYGAGFISVKPNGYNDGIEVGIDEDQFADEVQRITGTSTNQVSTVDGVGPNASGNVPLNSVRSINGEYFPDASGNVTINIGDGLVKTVNWIEPDDNGNVELPLVVSVDGNTADEHGEITLGALTSTDITSPGQTLGLGYSGEQTVASPKHAHLLGDLADIYDAQGNLKFVSTINNTFHPDANGNLTLNLPDINKKIVYSVDGIEPEEGANGNVVLNAVRALMFNQNEQDIIYPDENGIAHIEQEYVQKVNNTLPDANGNVNVDVPTSFSDLINDMSLIDETQAIQIYENLISQLTLRTTDLVDWDTATLQFLRWGDVADNGTAAGMSYQGDKNVCPTRHSHILSDITDFESKIYDKLQDDFVTVEGDDQTIYSNKTWSSQQTFTYHRGSPTSAYFTEVFGDGLVTSRNDNPNVWSSFYSYNGTYFQENGEIAFGAANSTGQWGDGVARLAYGSNYGALVLYTDNLPILIGKQGAGGTTQVFINALQDGARLENSPSANCSIPTAIATVGWVNDKIEDLSEDTWVTLATQQTITATKTFEHTGWGTTAITGNTISLNQNGNQYSTIWINGTGNNGVRWTNGSMNSQICLTNQGNFNFYTNGVINIMTDNANQARLNRQPTETSDSSLAIATCGYVQKYSGGKVKTVQGVAPDANGNVSLTNVFANKSHTHPHTDISDWATATMPFVETTDVQTSGTNGDRYSGAKFVANIHHLHDATSIEGIGKKAEQDAINGDCRLAVNVDGHSAYEGDVDFGLSPNRFVKTDANGHLVSLHDSEVVVLPDGETGTSATIPFVSDVSWNGTQLVITKQQLVFTNGILTAWQVATGKTINTVTYNP